MFEKMNFEAPKWNRIYSLLIDQSRKIFKSGFKPDVIVGVSRGGWIPARILSDLLDNTNLANVKTELYLGIDKANSSPKLTQLLSTDVLNKNVLIVDEVADTGQSLKLVIEHVLERGAIQVKTVTLFCKARCVSKPDFWGFETDRWVVFPWEIKETVVKILEAHKNDPDRVQKELESLEKGGVSRRLISKFFQEITGVKKC